MAIARPASYPGIVPGSFLFTQMTHRNRPVCNRTIDLYEGRMILAVLFSIPFLIMPNMEFAFFTAAAHWVDIFIELSATIPKSLFCLVTASSDPIGLYLKLGFFAPTCIILHLLTLNCICHLDAHSPSSERLFWSSSQSLCFNHLK